MKRVLLLSLICFGSSLYAEDLLEIYELAIQNDTEFASAVVQDEIRKENMRSALASLLPNMSVGIGGKSTSKWKTTYPSEFLRDPRSAFTGVTEENNSQWQTSESPPGGWPAGWSANMSQVVLNVPTFIRYRTSQIENESGKQNFVSAQQLLLIRVATAYFDALRARDSLEASIASEEAIKHQLDQAEQRFEVGLSAITDVLNARASYDNAIVGRIQQVNNLDIVFLTLQRLTGEPIAELSRISPDYPIVDPEPNVEDIWVDVGMRNNPQIISATNNYRASRQRHWAQLASYLPSISMSMSYSYSESPINFGGNDLGFDLTRESIGVSYGIGFSAVFQGGAKLSQNRTSALNKQNSRLQLAQQRQNIEEQIRRQFRTVTTEVHRLAARKRAIESSEASLEATETGYEVGTRNIVEVLQAQQNLFNARFNYESGVYDYILGMLRLKQLSGQLNDNEIIDINQYLDDENVVTRLNSVSGE